MKFDWKRDLRRLLLVVVASVIIAINLKMFVRPAEMYPGGVNGLSMLMQTIFSTYLGVSVPFTEASISCSWATAMARRSSALACAMRRSASA